MSKCPYCTTGKIIHTNSHCWDIDPIEDMGCYSKFKDNKLFGFSKWKFCPICGRKLEKEKTPQEIYDEYITAWGKGFCE